MREGYVVSCSRESRSGGQARQCLLPIDSDFQLAESCLCIL